MALRNTSRWLFSARRRVLLSEHVSPAVLKRCSLCTLYRPTIPIRYDDAIRLNTNRLFGPLFGTEANTNRIFGTSLAYSAAQDPLSNFKGLLYGREGEVYKRRGREEKGSMDGEARSTLGARHFTDFSLEIYV